MKNYTITTDGRGTFVMNGSTTVGGPYFDTEKETADAKAKRRIRDLKRKEFNASLRFISSKHRYAR